MIDIMDQGVGQMVNELKKQGAYENTLVLFLSDNGGNAEGMGFGGSEGQTRPLDRDPARLKPLPKDKPQLETVPGITREGKVVMIGKQIMAGPDDTYLGYLRPWAQVSNTPFRKYKHFVYEGGIAAPLIVHWPAGIAGSGEYRDQVGNVIDIMPTLVELAGAKYPGTFNGQSITPEAGVSLVPSFANHALQRDAICWEHEMNRAVRSGKWKLVSPGGMMDGGYGKWKYYINGPWELYDMENDPTELTDLSAKFPDQVARLRQIWENWAKEVPVHPTPWKKRERVQMHYIDPSY
jgi:arylsulfatase